MIDFNPILSYHAVERIGQRLCPHREMYGRWGRWIHPSLIQQILDDVIWSVNQPAFFDKGKGLVTKGKLACYAISPWGDVITVMDHITKEYRKELRMVKRSWVRLYLTESDYLNEWKLETVGRRK